MIDPRSYEYLQLLEKMNAAGIPTDGMPKPQQEAPDALLMLLRGMSEPEGQSKLERLREVIAATAPNPAVGAAVLADLKGLTDRALVDDLKAKKTALDRAIQEGRAGVSRKTGYLCRLEDEPDAIPVPYNSIFDPEAAKVDLTNFDLSVKPEPKPRPKGWPKSGSNYTPPKKKRKKRK